MTARRRQAVVVVATLLALVVVALASTSGVDDGRAREVTGAMNVVATIVQAGSVMFTILMAGFVAWLYLGGMGGGERRRRTPLWGTVVAGLLMMLILWQLDPIDPSREVQRTERPPSEAFPIPTVPPSDGDEDAGRGGWAIGAIGALVVLLVAGGVALARRRDVVIDVPTADAMPASPAARDDAVTRAHACTDPRQAVLLAFAAAEAILSVDLATRRPPATSAREWAGAVRIRALDEIVRRYEIARFSHHAVTAGDRAAALAALDDLASVTA